jgi:lipoprotein-anchoring transpeptidase ErfK/SrfK
VLERFARRNVNGVNTIFSVRAVVRAPDCTPMWYRVQLPLRPNGITGFVRAEDVTLSRVETRIVVDISARRIEFFRAGERVLAVRSAVGADATPTPTGRFYVNQRLRAQDPAGPFGPGAIGVSAFSPVLRGWVQGGPIAIHGTNRPDSIGRAITNGCLRIRNDVLLRLYRETPGGTPVVIRA